MYKSENHKLDYVAQAYVIPRVPTKCKGDATNVENIVGEQRANSVVFCACFGDVNFDDFGQKEQNASQDAHLGRLGFP